MGEYLTTEELAEKLKVSRQTVWLWRKQGLPALKIGRSIRFNAIEVDEWIKEQSKDNEG